MSCYHNLSVLISLAARVAFGVEVILGAFICGTKRPLKELHVLDAGKETKISSTMNGIEILVTYLPAIDFSTERYSSLRSTYLVAHGIIKKFYCDSVLICIHPYYSKACNTPS